MQTQRIPNLLLQQNQKGIDSSNCSTTAVLVVVVT